MLEDLADIAERMRKYAFAHPLNPLAALKDQSVMDQYTHDFLFEGYALRAVDIDIIYLNGYGFPAYRGGPMWYADTVGLKKVYDRICEFHKQHGELWEPAPLLKRLAEEGKGFKDFNKDQGAAA